VLFDDDAVFHRDFERRLREVMPRLPPAWMICYLGAMQYSFEHVAWEHGHPPPTFSSAEGGTAQTYYHGHGTSIASHAVVVRDTAYLHILSHLRLGLMPVDDGALSATCNTFHRQCVTLYPSLVIQDLDMASTIGTSVLQATNKTLTEKARIFHWVLSDYLF
jgi:hypothetical protein